MWFMRSVVMEAIELKLRKEYMRTSSAKLREIRTCRGAATPEYAIIDQILYERDFWHRFFTNGLVAWLSLAVALTALILTLFKKS